MMEIIKIGLLGIIGVLLAGWFKGSRPEYALYIGAGAAVLIFAYAVRFFYSLIEKVLDLQQYMEGGEDYLGTLLKIVGITYICEFSAGICKDAGFAAMAGQIEVLGKLAVMFAGLPVLLAVLEQIQSFL